ncbi:MAG: hypothetical protein MUF27_06360 [Acidobacteria bacterium]|nr:hypothetical protein [Acidobacteriota bacterium]
MTRPVELAIEVAHLFERLGGEVSDRQWSDVIGVIRIQQETLDLGYLNAQATARGLERLLEKAVDQARV